MVVAAGFEPGFPSLEGFDAEGSPEAFGLEASPRGGSEPLGFTPEPAPLVSVDFALAGSLGVFEASPIGFWPAPVGEPAGLAGSVGDLLVSGLASPRGG